MLENVNSRTKKGKNDHTRHEKEEDTKLEKRTLMEMEEMVIDHAIWSMAAPRLVCCRHLRTPLIHQDKTREEGSKALQCSLKI